MKANSRSRLTAACAAVFGMAAITAQADTFTWNPPSLGAGTNAWNVAGSWSGGPAFPNATSDVANVTANITGAQTITLDQQIRIGVLNIGDPTSPSVYTIAAGTGGSLIFDNGATNGQIMHAAAGATDVITAPIVIGGNGKLELINNHASNSFQVSGGISGAGDLLTSLSTNRSILLGGANTYTGATTVGAGTVLRIITTNSLPATSAVTVNGQLLLSNGTGGGTNQTIGSLAGGSGASIGTNSSSGGTNATLTTGGLNTSTTYSGSIGNNFGTGATSATGFAKIGSGTQTLDGVNAAASLLTYTGTTTVSRGALIFDRSAATVSTSGTNGGFTIGGVAEFVFKGGTGATNAQTFTSYVQGTGLTKITAQPAAGASADLNFGTFTRGTTNNGVALFRGTALGSAAPGTANVANIRFGTTAPTLAGAGAAGTPGVGIIKGAIGDTAVGGNGTGFVTYDATNGVRLLTAAEQAAYAVAATTDNSRISSTPGATLTPQQLQSLQIDATGAPTDVTFSTGNLIANGGILFTGDSAITTTGGTLAATLGGVTDLTLISSNTAGVTISSSLNGNLTSTFRGDISISGSGDITIAGPVNAPNAGTISINGPGRTTYQATTTSFNGFVVNGGTLLLNNGAQTSKPLVVNSAGTLDLNSDFTVNGVTASGAIVNSTGTLRTLTIGLGNGGSTFSGAITGAINFTKHGSGTATFSTPAAYTGATTVNGGAITASGALSATSAVAVNGSAATAFRLGASDVVNDAATLSLNNGHFETLGFSDTLGALTAVAGTTSTIDLGTGASVLHLADSSAFFSGWTGTLTIANWSGNATGGGTDQLFFGSNSLGLSAAQLAGITWTAPFGAGDITGAQYVGAVGEIVPIPEPATALSLLAGFGFLALRRRR